MKSFQQTKCRLIIVSAVLVILVAALRMVPWRLVAAEAVAPGAEESPEQTDPVKPSPAQDKIFQALHQPARIDFFKKPLEMIVASVKDNHKIDLQLDEEALRGAGIKRDTPVTLHARDVNLNNALWLLCRQLGLTHVIRGDDLLITTPQEAERIVREGGIDPDQIDMWSGNGKVVGALIYPTDMEFIDVPLPDVTDFLADEHDIPILVDEGTLGDDARAGTGVTFNFRGITLNGGLRLMLDRIGLTHVVSHGVLLITTPQERDHLVQRVAFEPDDIRFSPLNKQILAALAENTRVEFNQVLLQDAVDDLQHRHRIRIRLDRRAIRKAGMKIEAPITQNIQGVTLHSALKEILGEIGLAHVVQHEVLLITTPEESRRRLREGALAPTDTKPAVPTSARETIGSTLQKRVTVECREKPFDELVDVLKQQCDVEIRIDDWGLATAAQKRDFPCTIAVKDVSLRSVLSQLLRGVQLGYIVEDDLVVITGREISDRRRHANLGKVAYNLRSMGAFLKYGTDSHAPYIAGVRFYVDPGRVTDDVFGDLKTLSRLRRLDLSNTRVTDAGMVHLTNFPELLELDLNTRIADAGLTHVAALTELRNLNLRHTRVTDDGLKHIQGLMELRELHLGRSNVTDAGLKHLAGLPRLTWLDLSQTQVTGVGLSHLRSPRLNRLSLSGSKVSDAGLAHLKGLTRIQNLDLSDTEITDGAVVHLRAWWQEVQASEATNDDPTACGVDSGRVHVIVRDTKLTRAAAAELMKKSPELRVIGK